MQPAKLSLDDKYTAESGRVFLTGSQALVRLPMVQRRRDLAAEMAPKADDVLPPLPGEGDAPAQPAEAGLGQSSAENAFAS